MTLMEPRSLRYHSDTDTWTIEDRPAEEVADEHARRWLAWLGDEVAELVPRTIRVSVEGGPVLWERG